MRCPACDSKTQCVDSRWKAEAQTVYRRHECAAVHCGLRFSTKEEVVALTPGRPASQRPVDFIAEAKKFAARIQL